MKAIELPKQERSNAIASIQRYFEQNLAEHIGELPAGLLLAYFLEEIGPVIYNQAISDAQSQLERKVMDLSGELSIDSFQYWPRLDAKWKIRR